MAQVCLLLVSCKEKKRLQCSWLFLLVFPAPLANNVPRFVQEPISSIKVVRGDNLTLECVVEGAPVPVVTWNKYGGQLPEARYKQVLGE